MARKRLPPIHTGELFRDGLNELGISLNRLARDARIPLSRVSLIVNGTWMLVVATSVCALTTGYTYFHQDRRALLDKRSDKQHRQQR